AALGLRGLLKQALDNQDLGSAAELAARARLATPGDPWLAETLFMLLVKAGRFREAGDLVEDAARYKAMSRDVANRRRAQVLYELAAKSEVSGDPAGALTYAKQANAADPDFAPAAIRLARYYAAADKLRRADRILARAFAGRPDPELIRAA